MVKATPSEPIRVSPGERVELECTVFGSPVPQAQWTRGIQLNQVTYIFLKLHTRSSLLFFIRRVS